MTSEGCNHADFGGRSESKLVSRAFTFLQFTRFPTDLRQMSSKECW